MSDFLHNELTNHLNAYKRLREQQPDLSPDDPAFRDTLEGESKLVEALDWAVRHYREEKALEAATYKAVEDTEERRKAADKRAADWLMAIENALKRVQRETGDIPVFERPGYTLTLTDMINFVDIRVHPDAKPVDISALPSAEKLEALHRQNQELDAILDQIKAEERALKERKERLNLLKAKNRQDTEEILPSLLKPGKKSVQLPTCTVILRDLPRGVVITDPDVLDDKYLIPREPEINKPAILQDLSAGKTVLGARLDNGGTAISFRTK